MRYCRKILYSWTGHIRQYDVLALHDGHLKLYTHTHTHTHTLSM